MASGEVYSYLLLYHSQISCEVFERIEDYGINQYLVGRITIFALMQSAYDFFDVLLEDILRFGLPLFVGPDFFIFHLIQCLDRCIPCSFSPLFCGTTD